MMIKTRKDLKIYLEYEKKLYKIRFFAIILPSIKEQYNLYRYNYILRHLEYCINTNKKLGKILWKIKLKIYQKRMNIFVPANTCDIGLHFIHYGYRLINGKAKIGKDFVMHANTYVVAGGTNDDVPTIGNNVVMGVNAVVLGNAIVGDNIAIAAAAVVNKNFAEGNMTIGGIPAKKISGNTKNDWNKKSKIDLGSKK